MVRFFTKKRSVVRFFTKKRSGRLYDVGPNLHLNFDAFRS